jgi:hypothetical protein
MIWTWWAGMLITGFVVGAIAAWTMDAARVFMKTLAIPLVLVASRLLWPTLFPIKNTPGYVFIDLLILAMAALVADYAIGLKLGRNDRAGYREDSVGH